MASQLLDGRFRGETDAGLPLVGGLLYTYVSGTTTPKAAYTDATLATPATNPITLNARGEAQVWLGGTGFYSLKLTDSAGLTIWTVDGVTPADIAGSSDALRNDLASASPAKGADLVAGAARSVDDIAALRASIATTRRYVFVAGYYAAGDGGGGWYWLDASDTTTADNGGTIIIASDGGRWKLHATASVSIKQFGAKCDGVTLDTESVQTAVNWCTANRVKLFVPYGTCLIGGITVTTQGLNMEGVGWSSVFKIIGNAGDFGFKFINPNGGVGESGHWSSDAILKAFRITSAATANKLTGLWFENSEFNILERVQVELSTTYAGASYANCSIGLLGAYTQDGTVNSCSFSAGKGAWATGVYLKALSTAMRPNNNVWTDCRFQSNGGYGFRNESGEANAFLGCSWQDNSLGGHLEAADGSGNGPRGTVITSGSWFEINGGASIQADVTEMLSVTDSFFPDASTTSALYVGYGVQCLFDGNQSIGGAKPITIAGGSGNIVGSRNSGFGTVTFSAGTGAIANYRGSGLTDASTVSVDAHAGTYFALASTAGRVIAAPSNSMSGSEITFELANTSGAPITHTFAAAYAISGGGAFTIAAGKLRTIRFAYNQSRGQWIQVGSPSADI